VTHTLHRRGDPDALRRDYVVLLMAAQGVNADGSTAAKREALTLARRFHPVNLGDGKYGNLFSKGATAILTNVDDRSVVHAVFDDEDAMLRYVTALKQAALGLSVVVTGVFAPLYARLATIGLGPHTVQFSLGTFGRTERLPSEAILEVTTLCGHHMVATQLVHKLVRNIRSGRATPEVAARELARQCVCGVYNPARAAGLLERLAAT
jgi:hypothetical protein